MPKKYKIGGSDNNSGPIKSPGLLKRVFATKDMGKFNRGETDVVKVGKGKILFNTGNTVADPTKKEVKTSRYMISPATEGKPGTPETSSYQAKREFTDAKGYKESSSPEKQAERAGKPRTAYGKQVEEGYQNAVKNKQDTYSIGGKSFKAGTTTKTPGTPAVEGKPAVYGEKKEVTYGNKPEVLPMNVLPKFRFGPKKVDNVKQATPVGYEDQKKKRNTLNKMR